MQNALSELLAARASLLAASPTKGADRDRAIRPVAAAIAEVKPGIASAAANGL